MSPIYEAESRRQILVPKMPATLATNPTVELGRKILSCLGALALASVLSCKTTKPFAQFTFVTTEEGVVQPLVLEKAVSRTWCITHTPASELDWSLRGRALEADHSYAVALAIDSVPGANLMTDVSVKSETTSYFFSETNCVTVTGDVGRIQ